MNNLKKVLAGLLAVSCILTAASCSLKGEESSTATPQTADQVIQKSYQAIELDCDVSMNYIDNFTALGDTGNIFICGNTDEKTKMFITDKEFLSFNEIDFELPEGDSIEAYYRTAVTNNGTIFVLATITDYGDFELPDYDDPDFDYESFDYEAMNEAATTSYKLYTFDSEGNSLSENEIKGLDKYGDDEDNSRIYINEFMPIGDDKVLLTIYGSDNDVYLSIGADGVLSDPIDFGDDRYFYPSGTDANGNFVFMSYQDGKNVLKTFDSSTMTLSNETISFEEEERNFNKLCKGSGDYSLYLSSTTSLYGLKSDNTLEELINWIDSDLSGDYISGIIPLDDGDFIVHEQNWSNGNSAFYRLTKRDASELANTQIITLAVNYSDNDIVERVKEFNKTSTDYRIKIEDYNKYYTWDEESNETTNTPEKQLKQDLASGKTFDIICMNGSSSLFNNLASKGALTDLYAFMGKDGSVSEDDILPSILSAGEYDGKLISLAPSCYVYTYACKTKYCDKENWTLDDMIETYENLPEGMKLFSSSNTKNRVLDDFLYGTSTFIDYQKGTCNFDSPEFIKILNFSNQFADEEEDIDWETATDDEMQAYWKEQELAYRNDKALLSNIYMSSMREYARAVQADFGDDITLVGYPSADGNGAKFNTSLCYAIMSSSPNKDACWDFISGFFTEEYQTNERNMYQIPALKSAFEKKLDEAMNKPYYLDADGKKVEYDDSYYIGEEAVNIDPLTKEQRDYLEQYILNAKSSSYYYDEDIYKIIDEESKAFFAGEKTAEETASIIQNRVSIIVSEQS